MYLVIEQILIFFASFEKGKYGNYSRKCRCFKNIIGISSSFNSCTISLTWISLSNDFKKKAWVANWKRHWSHYIVLNFRTLMGERLSNLGVNDLCLLENQLEQSLRCMREKKVDSSLSLYLLLLIIVPSTIIMMLTF